MHVTSLVEKIPREVLDLMKILAEAGHEAYLVGGCVRDLILGKEPHDYDIATSATPQEVIELLEKRGFKVIPIGMEFGTVKVLLPRGIDVEITTFRRELYPEYGRGGRRPVVQWAKTLAEDVSRRDFTINALALDVYGNVIDLVGGLADLASGIIRFVGNPVERILEDPLRLLRAIRFASALGFRLSPETEQAIREHGHHIMRVSWERIRDEVVKMIEKRALSRGLQLMAETGLLRYVFPELEEAKSILEHVVHTIKRLEDLGIRDITLMLSALLHDIGKVETYMKSGEFQGHEEASARTAEEVLKRLKLPNKVIREVILLIRNHELPHYYMASRLPLEKWLSTLLPRLEQRPEMLEKLLLLAYADTGDRKYLEVLNELKKRLTQPKPLVTGEMIMRLFPSAKAGKWIGELKNELYRLQLEIGAETPEEVLREAERRGILEMWRKMLQKVEA